MAFQYTFRGFDFSSWESTAQDLVENRDLELELYTTTIDTSLALKANIASPTLTGVPAAPTATPGTSTTQLATTAFVTTADNLKANLASPTFTGTPTLPTGTIATTQTAADSSTKVATTAFVTTADNLKANLASPTFTGTPTLPTGTIATTQSAGNNTTAVATTAFVASAVPLAWTSYTPTLIQGITVGKTVNYAKYVQIQKTVFLQIMLTCTSGGLGGTISVSFPSGLTPVYTHAQRVIGTFFIHDNTTALYSGLAMGSSPITGYGYGSTNNMGANTPAMTLVTNDQVSIAVQYEVA